MEKTKVLVQILALITSVIALATAVIGFSIAQQNKKQIAEHQKQIKRLEKEIVDTVASTIKIDSPKAGEVISKEVYDEMHGTFTGELPENCYLWVLARDRYNYFLMYPRTQFVRVAGKWSQSNIRLNTPGRWELHVCLANSEASEWFENKAKQNDWAGFNSLPQGAETVQYVVVQKE